MFNVAFQNINYMHTSFISGTPDNFDSSLLETSARSINSYQNEV